MSKPPIQVLLHFLSGKRAPKVQRDAFLYLDPREPKDTFAQCGTCRLFTGKTCLLFSKNFEVQAKDSCGFYNHGEPQSDLRGREWDSVTPEEAGYFKGSVRCENCKYLGENYRCELYVLLNKTLPAEFSLEEKVDPKG